MPHSPTFKRDWPTDFATIFAHLWYWDFPLSSPIKANRADWTMHIGVTVRATADLMGLFTHFESGGRTDAVLRDIDGTPIGVLEWENRGLHEGHAAINEFKKLKRSCSKNGDLRFACL